VERAQRFTLDAKRLIALADAGVPSRVIDLMVALSYPRAFAINTASRQGERVAAARSYGQGTAPTEYVTAYNPLCYNYDYMYPYSSYPYSSYDCSGVGRGYGYGYDWYSGGYPVTIIYSGSSSGGSRPHGRVVNGQGYAKGGDAGPELGTPRPSDSWSRPSNGLNEFIPGSSNELSGRIPSHRTQSVPPAAGAAAAPRQDRQRRSPLQRRRQSPVS
jgi:hypothetical protein